MGGELRGACWRLLSTIGISVLLSACGSDPGPAAGTLVVGKPGSSHPAGPCESGTTKKCGIELARHDGVTSCYEGESTCVDGAWSDCGKGSVINLKSATIADAGSAVSLSP